MIWLAGARSLILFKGNNLVRPEQYLYGISIPDSFQVNEIVDVKMHSTDYLEVRDEVPVLIIGGGPSGLLSAYLLTRLGSKYRLRENPA